MLTFPPAKPLLPRLHWWLLLGVIVFAAGALRYTGYNFSLPYIDHVDEPAYNLAARMTIDFGSPMPLGMHGYPPGIVAVNYLVMSRFQAPGAPPSTILWIVRLISITFSLFTLVALALLAYRVFNPLAGLLVAAVWAWSPIIVEHSRYATADNFVTFFTIFALFLMLTGVFYRRQGWIYGALLSEIFAIVFKYQAVFVLPLLLALPAWGWLLRPSAERRSSWRSLVMLYVRMGLILAAFFFWLTALFPALEATRAPDWSAPTERLGIPSLETVAFNYATVFRLFILSPLWYIGWAGLALLLAGPMRRRVILTGIAALLLTGLLWVIGISFYGLFDTQSFRQFITPAALLACLSMGGFSLIAYALSAAFQSSRLAAPGTLDRQRLARVLGTGIVVLGSLALSIGDIRGAIANAEQHTLPDHRVALADWMDRSLPPGPIVAESENHKTFNRDWGGYNGLNVFPLVTVVDGDQAATPPLEAWRAQGARYGILRNFWYDALGETEAGRALLAQIQRIKSFAPSPDYRGPDVVVIQLTPIQHPVTSEALGPFRLIGYDQIVDEALADAPDAALQFRLYWQASAPADGDYEVFNHLLDETGTLVAQIDGQPLFDVRRPTDTWGDDPEEVFVSRDFTLALPEDLPPGSYHLVSGFYRADTGARLMTQSGESSVPVMTLRIDEPTQAGNGE